MRSLYAGYEPWARSLRTAVRGSGCAVVEQAAVSEELLVPRDGYAGTMAFLKDR